MKYRISRSALFLLCLLMLSLVCFADDHDDVFAVDNVTVELSEYEASYQWAKLTGTLSSTRSVRAVGFRYRVASDFVSIITDVRLESVTNPFVAFIYLDLSGDLEYIAEAYCIYMGNEIRSEPVRIKRTVLPECSVVIDQIRDTSAHVNLTINTVDNQLSEVKYVLYQAMHHRRTVTLGTDVVDTMTYSFDITGLTPDSEYTFRPSYVLPDGTEIKWESITWKTLKTSQVSTTPVPTTTPAPTPTTSIAPTTTPTSTTAPTPAPTPTSAPTTQPVQTTTSRETTTATTMQTTTQSQPTTTTTATDSDNSARFESTDVFLLVILGIIALALIAIAVALFINIAKKSRQ